MPRQQYIHRPYPFVAGPLGHVEGLSVCAAASEKPLCRYFGGLPYALPPVGPHRFRRPRPLPDHHRYGTKANPGRFTGQCAYCPQLTHGGALDSSLLDENCLQLNIYMPARPPPPQGWPVLFYIHGGFLQWGTPNSLPNALTPLLSETAFNAMIVAPAYRVNLFGFIAGTELQTEAEQDGECAGNLGFWDQRLALEWTAMHIRHFGGDPHNITVAGYSAGAHSTFHQLAHELYFVPDDEAIIKRAIMWSNSPGVQPRTPTQHQRQFDELLNRLKIPLDSRPDEKLRRLRETPAQQLVEANDCMQMSEFRATTDGSFVHTRLMACIDDGDFGRRMQTRGITLMNGECRDEHTSYQTWRTPADSYDALRARLIADYPDDVVDRLLRHFCGTAQTLPLGVTDWKDLFGRIYATMQVHSLERGFHHGLARSGLVFGRDVLRYRFDWRARCIDASFPLDLGVTHASDLAIWFWGLDFGDGLSESDKVVLRGWNTAFALFVSGGEPEWTSTSDVKEMRRLQSDGRTDVWLDDQWEQGCRVWDLVNGNLSSSVSIEQAKPSL